MLQSFKRHYFFPLWDLTRFLIVAEARSSLSILNCEFRSFRGAHQIGFLFFGQILPPPPTSHIVRSSILYLVHSSIAILFSFCPRTSSIFLSFFRFRSTLWLWTPFPRIPPSRFFTFMLQKQDHCHFQPNQNNWKWWAFTLRLFIIRWLLRHSFPTCVIPLLTLTVYSLVLKQRVTLGVLSGDRPAF